MGDMTEIGLYFSRSDLLPLPLQIGVICAILIRLARGFAISSAQPFKTADSISIALGAEFDKDLRAFDTSLNSNFLKINFLLVSLNVFSEVILLK